MPDAETVIAFVLALLDQMTVPEQLLAVKIIFVPKHTILSVSSEVIVGAFGMAFTTIVCVADAKLTQPFTVQVAL